MGMDPQLTGLASQKRTLNASEEFHGNQGLLKMQGRESGLRPEGSRGIPSPTPYIYQNVVRCEGALIIDAHGWAICLVFL